MMDAVDPDPHYLVNTIEMNRQLHVHVQKKQEEISALQQRNAQLKEMVRQTEIYAAVLDAFTPQAEDTSECVSLPASPFPGTEPSEQHFSAALQPSWLESLLDHTPPEEEKEGSHRIQSECINTGVKRQLWPNDTESRSTYRPAECPTKKSRLDRESLDRSEHCSSEHLEKETVQVFGSFRGLRVLKATSSASSDVWREGGYTFFRTSIRDHSTVRTRVFPHGKTFTSRTPDGGCRFLWIPKQT